VMAANGIGTPRLLLLSRSNRFPDGLANSSGLVGKRLMMHPSKVIVGIYEDKLDSWVGPFGASIVSSEFAETVDSRGFLRGSHWELVPSGPPLFALGMAGHKSLSLREGWGHNLHRTVDEVFGHTVAWGVAAEDLPAEGNDITLDPALTDSDGIPAPRVRYRISDMTRANLTFNEQRAWESHEAAGATKIRAVEGAPDCGWHLLGTARMGDDPATSVVDRNCRSHDVPNLYVIDGSVFVTSGAVNPTATICAIAHRCARHIVSDARLPTTPR
jgi:choline dehydrogenase-like flavoprotein